MNRKGYGSSTGGKSSSNSSQSGIDKHGHIWSSKIGGGPLSKAEYSSRVVTSEGTRTISIEKYGYKIRYAYVSQRGYYPESLDKSNQDALCVHNDFCDMPERHFFGVFDGHGEHGTACSEYARDNVPKVLERATKDGQMTIERAIHKAFVDTNVQLHRSTVEDSMSGTTGISVLVDGKRLYVGNVGDSRATLAERQGRNLIAIDLSHDQTPFRQDECERVKRSGARVLTLDQLEGLKDPNVQCWGSEEDDDGDPPRLWSQHGAYPGTAFTRSIGDAVAEKIGVYAVPELLVRELSSDNPFFVLASDGVFEFLSSQSVVDMVSKFEDPQEAAIALVAESYRLWLQYETRTDDITVIVGFIDGLSNEVGKEPSTVQGAHDNAATMVAVSSGMNRRVRRDMSKAKRASIEQMMAVYGDDDSEEWTPPNYIPKKTPDEIRRISSAVKANFLFQHLNEAQRKLIFGLMEKRQVSTGEVIIKQGDKGDHFYVVESGEFDVFVKQGDGPPQFVHTYTTKGGTHPCFGELALMYGKPRAATVQASTNGSLWSLNRRAFKHVLQKTDTKAVIKTLRAVDVLKPLNSGQLQRLADMLSETSYEEGEYILTQGEEGEEFFIIESGEVVCTVSKNPNDKDEIPREVLRLKAGQYFGERALLSNARRAANVVALNKVHCVHIGRTTFEEVLGPLQGIIDADRRWREKAAILKESQLRRPSVAQMLSFVLGDLKPYANLYTTNSSVVSLVKHKGKSETYVMRQTSIAQTTEQGLQHQLIKMRNIMKTTLPLPLIPSVVRVFKDQYFISELMYLHGFCNLDGLLSEPLSVDAVKFIASELVAVLEHLHMDGVIFRGTSLDTLLISDQGHLQVVDFRFAKRVDGKTFTLCGSPDFMAPEMIEQTGHNAAVDWWGLGVLIFYLLAGHAPFSEEQDEEVKIYSKISQRRFVYPSTFDRNTRDLIDKLWTADPNTRLGYGTGGVRALKEHAFFEGIHWDSISNMDSRVPAEVVQRMKAYEPEPYTPLEEKQYEGEAWYQSL